MKSGEITVTVDHELGHAYATTRDGTLVLKEDAIGLHADVLITLYELLLVEAVCRSYR